jgi:hypothetical protein
MYPTKTNQFLETPKQFLILKFKIEKAINLVSKLSQPLQLSP